MPLSSAFHYITLLFSLSFVPNHPVLILTNEFAPHVLLLDNLLNEVEKDRKDSNEQCFASRTEIQEETEERKQGNK